MSDRYLDHLAGVRLFSSLSRRELGKVAKATDELALPEGKELVTQGAPGHECFVIVEGGAVVTIDGTEVARLGPGDHFGELSLLDGGPRTATVTTTAPTTVLVIGQREFAAVIDAVPELGRKLLESLARRLRDLDEHLHG